MAVSLSAHQTRALVLDVEGTTTPIEFVYQVLFPFARSHVAGYLQRDGHSPEGRAAIEQLRREYVAETGDASEFGLDKILAYAGALMDADRKSPGLKALTPWPIASTTPANSMPRIGCRGRLQPKNNRISAGCGARKPQSVRVTGVACTATSTSPVLG